MSRQKPLDEVLMRARDHYNQRTRQAVVRLIEIMARRGMLGDGNAAELLDLLNVMPAHDLDDTRDDK